MFKANNNHEVFFDTWEGEVFDSGGHQIKGYKQIYRWHPETNTRSCLAINSDNYTHVRNVDVANSIVDAAESIIGTPQFNSRLSGQMGNKYIMTFDAPDLGFNDGKTNNNFQLIGVNGFKYTAIKIVLGVLRIFCSNQIIITLAEGEKIIKNHSGKIDLQELTGNIEELIEVSKKFESRILELRNKKVEDEFISTVAAIDKISPKAAEDFLNMFQNVKMQNMYDLYNAYTYFITTVVGALHYKQMQYQRIANGFLK